MRRKLPMLRRDLLLSGTVLPWATAACIGGRPPLEPLHPAVARFHDPLGGKRIDYERWIVDSLPGAAVYATSESLRLAVADGLTAIARPRLPTRDLRQLLAGEIVPAREELQWEALIHRRLDYLTVLTLELAPVQRPWYVQLTAWGTVQVIEPATDGPRNHDIPYAPANDERYHAWRLSIGPEAWHIFLDGTLRWSYSGTFNLQRVRFGETRQDPLHGGTIDLRDVVYTRRPA